MLSKYHAVLLPVGALLHIVCWPQARQALRKPGPYIASAIGLILFAPVIAWNASHGWASFAFQGGRRRSRIGSASINSLRPWAPRRFFSSRGSGLS